MSIKDPKDDIDRARLALRDFKDLVVKSPHEDELDDRDTEKFIDATGEICRWAGVIHDHPNDSAIDEAKEKFHRALLNMEFYFHTTKYVNDEHLSKVLPLLETLADLMKDKYQIECPHFSNRLRIHKCQHELMTFREEIYNLRKPPSGPGYISNQALDSFSQNVCQLSDWIAGVRLHYEKIQDPQNRQNIRSSAECVFEDDNTYVQGAYEELAYARSSYERNMNMMKVCLVNTMHASLIPREKRHEFAKILLNIAETMSGLGATVSDDFLGKAKPFAKITKDSSQRGPG